MTPLRALCIITVAFCLLDLPSAACRSFKKTKAVEVAPWSRSTAFSVPNESDHVEESEVNLQEVAQRRRLQGPTTEEVTTEEATTEEATTEEATTEEATTEEATTEEATTEEATTEEATTEEATTAAATTAASPTTGRTAAQRAAAVKAALATDAAVSGFAADLERAGINDIIDNAGTMLTYENDSLDGSQELLTQEGINNFIRNFAIGGDPITLAEIRSGIEALNARRRLITSDSIKQSAEDAVAQAKAWLQNLTGAGASTTETSLSMKSLAGSTLTFRITSDNKVTANNIELTEQGPDAGDDISLIQIKGDVTKDANTSSGTSQLNAKSLAAASALILAVFTAST